MLVSIIIAEAEQVEKIERMRAYLAEKPRRTSGYQVPAEFAVTVKGYEIKAGDTMWRLGEDKFKFYVSLRGQNLQLTLKAVRGGAFDMIVKEPGSTDTHARPRHRMSLVNN